MISLSKLLSSQAVWLMLCLPAGVFTQQCSFNEQGLAGGDFKNCDVGATDNGISAWCTKPNLDIFASIDGGDFEKIQGGLSQVAVSEDSKIKWGVNTADQIWYRDETSNWKRVSGYLKQGTMTTHHKQSNIIHSRSEW